MKCRSVFTTLNKKSVAIKGYGTWLQIFKIDGKDNSNFMDMKVGDFTKYLKKTFNEVIQK